MQWIAPLVGAAVGGMSGHMKALQDAESEGARRNLEVVTEKGSPWTNMHGKSVARSADPWLAHFQGGMAGMETGSSAMGGGMGGMGGGAQAPAGGNSWVDMQSDLTPSYETGKQQKMPSRTMIA